MALHWLAALFALVVVAAVVAHEATHALVALVVADSVAVDWRGMATHAEYPDAGLRWRSYLVAVSPLLVGVLAGVCALALAGVPDTVREAIYAVGWLCYTTGGGIEEYRFRDQQLSNQAE
jgi:hypothetical protein